MKFNKKIYAMAEQVHDYVQHLNNSKIFAGLMIIILNIASRFVNFKFSKSVEMYLKHTLSKLIVVFAIAWMGTRDIYIALFITILFSVLIDYIFNEDSPYCCLPESFTNYHLELDKVSDEDIKNAKEVLEKANQPLGKVEPNTTK
jgi:hypothetical protein